MGTNYYWYPDRESMPYWEGLHIGKSSGGWTFALHVHNPEFDGDEPPEWTRYPRDLGGWQERWQMGFIVDEYGRAVTVDEMLDIICNRGTPGEAFTQEYRLERVVAAAKWGETRPWHKILADNYAVEGPNRLLRRRIDSRHCIGYGDGTWDLCIGEFG